MAGAYAVVIGVAAATVLGGWVYFRRHRMPRPPVGVVDLGDVAFVVVALVLLPFLYLALPAWLVGAFFALSVLSVLLVTLEPVVRRGEVRWLIGFVLIGADIALALGPGSTSRAYFAVNNLVLALVIVGVANLWAQGGLHARDLAVLTAAVIVYDVVATGWLPLTTDLIHRLAGLPFSPMVAWSVGEERWLGIGMGDLLLATVAPPVLRKAYGRVAGLAALAIALVTIEVMVAFAAFDLLRGVFPVMVVLGPLILAQYGFWLRRRDGERTTVAYLAAEPRATGEPVGHVAPPGRAIAEALAGQIDCPPRAPVPPVEPFWNIR
ncbi:MAG: hypothetical protein ACRDJH_12560 [Thermomicrobiales bacterium]